MWEHRNGILHSTESFHYKHEQHLLDLHIKQEYRKAKSQLGQDDKKLLDRPLSATLSLHNDDKQLWLNSMYWAREQQTDVESTAQHQLQRQRGAMRNWLQSGTFRQTDM